MGMGFAPTWLRQVSPLLQKTTLTTAEHGAILCVRYGFLSCIYRPCWRGSPWNWNLRKGKKTRMMGYQMVKKL